MPVRKQTRAPTGPPTRQPRPGPRVRAGAKATPGRKARLKGRPAQSVVPSPAPALPTPPAALRGTALSDADLERGRVSLERWEPRLAYRWDTGIAIGRFLAGLKAGKITGVRCERCNRTVTPPRAFCEWCFSPMDAWVDLPDTGTINTFSICYVTWDMRRLEMPQIPAVIEIDGTVPRVGFLHLIGGVPGRSVEEIRGAIRVGQRVRALWKPADDRTGAITDILHFAPTDGPGA